MSFDEGVKFAIIAIVATGCTFVYLHQQITHKKKKMPISVPFGCWFLLIVLIWAINMNHKNMAIYEQAEAYIEEGNYIAATETFKEIEGWQDTNDRISEIRIPYNYQRACLYEKAGNWYRATYYFLEVREYKDANDHFIKCAKKFIEELETKGLEGGN